MEHWFYVLFIAVELLAGLWGTPLAKALEMPLQYRTIYIIGNTNL